ncbi:hypothetical protein [Arthrobacter echini]
MAEREHISRSEAVRLALADSAAGRSATAHPEH